MSTQFTPESQSKKKMVFSLVLFVLIVATVWFYSNTFVSQKLIPQASTEVSTPSLDIKTGMVKIPGGRFIMGDTVSGRKPLQIHHEVTLGPFWIDQQEVTNSQFSEFIKATKYITTAEQLGYGFVFDTQEKTWNKVKGANWQHPNGPKSSHVGQENFPVVQVSWHDAAAYANWARKRLPTEAEWEIAARGGLFDCQFPWGREEIVDQQYQANYWQGWYPDKDTGSDGWRGLSETKSFLPNRFRLYDVAGNVREWCADWYQPDYYYESSTENPRGPKQGTERVCRGGSWLSSNHTDLAYLVSTRDSAHPIQTTNDLGFRCASSTPPQNISANNTAKKPPNTLR